ncbi:MAG: 50S ribosomal protein L17 [Clostridia bacterium]|nr:50S ribosomal protein L17 [Clostridia bacterium]
MAPYRKLGRPSDQRKAILRNLVTSLIVNGKVETTEARAKEVRSIAEKLITIAKKEYENTITVEKKVNNEKGQTVTVEVKNDAPSKLKARRQIMAYLYDVPEKREKDETKSEYKERTKDVKYPVVEKLFNEIAPKYVDRQGGYSRILKMGPRRGDGAEKVIIQLV